MGLARRTVLVGLLSGIIPFAASGQVVGGQGRRRDQTGSANDAPPDGVFVVVSVDNYAQTVRMRALDGSVSNVYVNSDVYDISKLAAGDRIQVNFVVPDAMNPKLAAANIWPVKSQ